MANTYCVCGAWTVMGRRKTVPVLPPLDKKEPGAIPSSLLQCIKAVCYRLMFYRRSMSDR